jgi:hypothetical protein
LNAASEAGHTTELDRMLIAEAKEFACIPGGVHTRDLLKQLSQFSEIRSYPSGKDLFTARTAVILQFELRRKKAA